MELGEIKRNTIGEIKNSLNGLKSKLDTTEQRTSELRKGDRSYPN